MCLPGLALGGLQVIFYISLPFSADTQDDNLPAHGPYVWSPRVIFGRPELFFKPDPFPGLPGPSVAPKGPVSTENIRLRIYVFIFPKVCPVTDPPHEHSRPRTLANPAICGPQGRTATRVG